MSQSRIAILAALNIADELHQEREDRDKTRGALADQAAKLGEILEDKISVGQ
jgi:cell division protein ZapA (FtsZ GTPase activity inhibitor)